jgi:hypothetical protein
MRKIIEKSSDGLTTSGLKVKKGVLFICINHGILLDTTLNALFEHGHGDDCICDWDNLVKKHFLNVWQDESKFSCAKGLTPRDVRKFKILSEYIGHLLLEESRSVWIAQREEGDGMMHESRRFENGGNGLQWNGSYGLFQNIKVVPVSISYEYDPTDVLKIPQLLAEANNEIYIKKK